MGQHPTHSHSISVVVQGFVAPIAPGLFQEPALETEMCWPNKGPPLIHEPSVCCSQASCSQTDGGAQKTGNKSILRDALMGPELITCQLHALWLCVPPRLGGRNEAFVGLLSSAFAQGNSGKWFSSHTGVFFNYALSGTRAELNNPHCSLCVFPVVQGRMHWVTREDCYLAEVLPGGLETESLLTCTPETQPALEASLGRESPFHSA